MDKLDIIEKLIIESFEMLSTKLNENHALLNTIEGRLNGIENLIIQEQRRANENSLFIFKNIKKMAQELEDLKAAVAKDTEVDQSAITLLQGLKQKLDDAIASGDPAQLTALSQQLGSNAQALSDAIVANTPADNTGGGGGNV